MRACLFALILSHSLLPAAEHTVHDSASLKAALGKLADNDTLLIAPGDYEGGNSLSGKSGVTIKGLDPANPPRFVGGSQAWHFSRCPGLMISDLHLSGQTSNGINLDDGGERDRPIAGIRIRALRIEDIGPVGNKDGIKCSGLTDLHIENCVIRGWGGQGIDFVGCHNALIKGCVLEGKEGFSASAGIQIKGGSSDVLIQKCRFLNAGSRPLNLGGSTGIDFFRPPDAKWEAARVTVEECEIEGSECAAAFVGIDGAVFRDNVIKFPGKWVFRILQETTADGFVPCRNARITGNRIVFDPASVRTKINIGPGTAAETFQIEGNEWVEEAAAASTETSGVKGK